MKRLREISRFECDVRVLRNGFCEFSGFGFGFGYTNTNSVTAGRYVSSGDMVPGDVYEVTDPGLEQFPADSLLLSGDCIVNESMLTGTFM